ncbi:striatin-interacting protein 1 homolog isoform X2 [Dermacentor silvarum]|uniref:striatin-interacting protein 1 homolog isoform X2 n=1 Tax=Dermacentor silvarum TaxID=543639 RepID=UPI00189BB0A8|nr:striatin-interacting protein 1 homolog isoform X2 [Dermacentor silvarum]
MEIDNYCFQQSGDSPDLEFVYDDADSHENEIAELYTYTEEAEFFLNMKAFEDTMTEYGFEPKWYTLDETTRQDVALRLMDGVDVSPRTARMQAVRAVLYIMQGAFGECTTLEEQPQRARQNVFLLYRHGFFHVFLQLLNMEIENSSAATSALRKPAVSLGDSTDLRAILSVLYIFVEVMRVSSETDTDDMKRDRANFASELAQPILGEELLAVTLFQMIIKFCSGATPHFPIKKVLLLLWKTILVSLGGTPQLRALKAQYRAANQLPPAPEDTVEVARTMRASSPPTSAADLIEAQQQRKTSRPFKRQSLVKQSSMDDFQDLEGDSGADEELRDMEERQSMPMDTPAPGLPEDPEAAAAALRPSTPAPGSTESQGGEAPPQQPTGSTTNEQPQQCDETGGFPAVLSQASVALGLPWVPKVRPKDIKEFLDATRLKFVGYQLPDDQTSLAGLPEPIHEGLRVLKQHMYTSLAEVQMKKEEDITKHPLSMKEHEIPATPTEVLYQAMLPSMPQYMIALLKILLAAAPTSKAKTESVNIMSDVLPEEMPVTVLQSMKLGIDVNRHKEIIIKAISAILLLLLKHLKINHVLQFEYMGQQLMFANCIPLVLKFFNQNINSYIAAKNTVSVIDFAACVIGEQPELTAETLEIGEQQPYCWRNMFSCINLLRVLNKLTKWKHSRIMMLVVFKSAPILKRALKVRHATLQLYVLKLLKMQTKYLGRQWRKSNMKTMSAIYQKVRHRLNDDWAYGNDLDARPWDFQAEEFSLQANINNFHTRRYDKPSSASQQQQQQQQQDLIGDFQPVDNSFLSVLGREVELSPEFKLHYQQWLQGDVFRANVDWDLLLCPGYL